MDQIMDVLLDLSAVGAKELLRSLPVKREATELSTHAIRRHGSNLFCGTCFHVLHAFQAHPVCARNGEAAAALGIRTLLGGQCGDASDPSRIHSLRCHGVWHHRANSRGRAGHMCSGVACMRLLHESTVLTTPNGTKPITMIL